MYNWGVGSAEVKSVSHCLRAAVAGFGDALWILRGAQRIGFAEAERRSARLALALVASGVAKGNHLGLLMPNGPDWAVAWLAAARIGAVVVPLSTFYSQPELGWVLRHADVHTLLCVPRYLNNDYLAHLERIAPGLARQSAGQLRVPELPCLRAVHLFDSAGPQRPWAHPASQLEATLAAEPALDADFLEALEENVTPADSMMLVYSSGSSGRPKGAVHSHGAVLRQAEYLGGLRDLGPEDRLYSPMPFFWVGGFVYTLVASLCCGSGILCDAGSDPGETLDLLERERATIVDGFPQHEKALCEHPSFPGRDLSSIRAGNLYRLQPAAMRPPHPEFRSNSLGMTETCAAHTADRSDVDLPEERRGSYGRAVPGVEHKIADPESGATLSPGVEGEICVRGRSVLQSLYKVEREDTFDADGYYHTGDAGRFGSDDLDGEVLYFTGRLGEMIKTGGANVTPSEVEAALDALPEVEASFVVGVPDATLGQRVTAAVVLVQGATADPDELRTRLRAALSAYKVPRHTCFLKSEELPRTDTGKIDKRRLIDALAARIARELP